MICPGSLMRTLAKREVRKFNQSRARPPPIKTNVSVSNKRGIMLAAAVKLRTAVALIAVLLMRALTIGRARDPPAMRK